MWDQILSFLRILSHLLKKSLMGSFIFYAVKTLYHQDNQKLYRKSSTTRRTSLLVIQIVAVTEQFVGNKAKGQSQNGGNKKARHAKFSEKRTFLTYEMFVSWKIWRALLSCYLRFMICLITDEALLPYYRRYHMKIKKLWVYFIIKIFLIENKCKTGCLTFIFFYGKMHFRLFHFHVMICKKGSYLIGKSIRR